ncbi:MAG: hypothetical protein R3B45_18310 [Bdellovibrionota bacterium]
MKKAKKQLKRCDSFVDYKEGKEILDLVQVSYLKSFSKSKLSRRQGRLVKEKTGATHFVNIKFRINDERLNIKPFLYYLNPSVKSKDRVFPRISLKLKKKNPFREAKKNKLILTSFKLLPNSVFVNFLSSTISNDAEGAEIINEKKHGNLPPLLSAISLMHIVHPYGFGYWDIVFRTFVSIEGVFYDFSQEILKDDITYIYRLKYYLIAPVSIAEISVHWLLGATFLGLGAGVGLNYYEDNFSSKFKVPVVFKYEIGHRAFVSDRFFLEFSVFGLVPSEIISNSLFKMDIVSSGKMGFGYIF